MNQSPINKLVNALSTPQKGSQKNKSRSRPKQSKRAKKGTVRGVQAMGTDRQGPLQLKGEQFAAYAPLETFHVSTGTTPGGIRVRGRELIAAVNSGSSATGGFGGNNTTGAGSYGLVPTSFPRLNAYTSIYEFYKFHKAKAIFQSSRPTTAPGVSEIAVDYDAKDLAPTSTIQMMRNISSSMSNIYADNACEISSKFSRLPKYATAEGSAVDINQVTQAYIYFAFEGLASTEVNTPQGYLVVEYDVEFFTPQ